MPDRKTIKLALKAHERAYTAAMRAMKDTGHREAALIASADTEMAEENAECENARARASNDPNLTNFKLLADAHAEAIRQLRKEL